MNLRMSSLAVLCLLLFGITQGALAQIEKSSYLSIRRNEAATIDNLREITAAQTTYQATVGNGNYGTLIQLREANLIDSALATGIINGYFITVTNNQASENIPANYLISAIPNLYNKTGRRSFYFLSNDFIRGADKRGIPANGNDPIIAEEYQCNSVEECEAKIPGIMRNIHSSEMTYQSTYGAGRYGSLCQLGEVPFIDKMVAAGSRYGYFFLITLHERAGQTPAGFNVMAIPQRYGQTGLRSFYISEEGVLRAADNGGKPIDANSPPVQY